MTDDDKISISRRKALGAIGTVGAAGALGSLGTYAQFTDTEEESYTFTAGGIDGEVRAGARYNGEIIKDFGGSDGISESGDLQNVEGFEESGALGLQFELSDVKPGDWGCFSFGITVENNPAWVAACLGYTNSIDGRAFEPEAAVDGNHAELDENDPFGPNKSYESPGELPANLLFIPFYKGDSEASDNSRFDPCIFFDEENGEFNADNYEGSDAVGTTTEFWDNSEDGLTPATLKQASQFQAVDTVAWDGAGVGEEYDIGNVIVDEGCVFLNGDGPTTANQQGAAPLNPGDETWMGWDWHLPFDTGNAAMGDSLDLQLGFVFGQTRHTESARLSNVFAPDENTPNN